MSDFAKMEMHLADLVSMTRQMGLSFGMPESHGLGWYLKEIETLPQIIRALLPAKVGDKVIITRQIKLSGAWISREHYLCRGSTAVVKSLGIDEGKVYANLVFDNESWIDDNGLVQPAIQKHYYGIGFEYFEKIPVDIASRPV